VPSSLVNGDYQISVTQKRDEGAADDVPDSSQLAAVVPRKCRNIGRESERGEL